MSLTNGSVILTNRPTAPDFLFRAASQGTAARRATPQSTGGLFEEAMRYFEQGENVSGGMDL